MPCMRLRPYLLPWLWVGNGSWVGGGTRRSLDTAPGQTLNPPPGKHRKGWPPPQTKGIWTSPSLQLKSKGFYNQFYNVQQGGQGGLWLPIVGTTEWSVFSTNAQSRFASVVVAGVPRPPHLARHTWWRPCFYAVPEATHEASWGPLKGTVSLIQYKEVKANFCGREKEGHFHYKNFLRALEWVPTWHTYTVGTKSLLSDWLQFSESQSERSILCLPCRYVMWVLILKLSKSFYHESDLLFYAHKSWLSICR